MAITTPNIQRTNPQNLVNRKIIIDPLLERMHVSCQKKRHDVSLSFRVWAPAVEPRAIVLGLHGISSYVGFFESFGKYFSEKGFVVYAYDARGHGNSSGSPNFTQSLEDLKAVIDHLRTYNLPIFIAGHSLGSIYALNYAQWAARNQLTLKDLGVAGLILASVPVKLYFPPDVIDMISAFGRGVIGKQVPMPLLWPTELRQAMEGKVMLDNPLIRKEYPLGYLLSLQGASNRLTKLRLPRIPTLVLQSLDDETISSDTLTRLFRRVERGGEGPYSNRPFLRTEILVDADHTLCNAFFPLMTGRHSPETARNIFDNIHNWIAETLTKYQSKLGNLPTKEEVEVPLNALASIVDKLSFDLFRQVVERFTMEELATFLVLTMDKKHAIKNEYREYAKDKYLKVIDENLPADEKEWLYKVYVPGFFGDTYMWGNINDVLKIAREFGVDGLKKNPKFARMTSAMITNEIFYTEASNEPLAIIPYVVEILIAVEKIRLRWIAGWSAYGFLVAKE
ncbi:MAG: alpha/beta fold hydrolase [Candidatus Micrarchaeota archaeon]|nr:alpha/beta fold hydrolase [Candidatus Micrarchaeota archaeon]